MNKTTQKLLHAQKLASKHLALSLGATLTMCSITGCATQAVTDGQVNANHAGYEQQQGAIKTLNDSGQHRVASYSLSKSQCWLDVSYHEFSRNDRSAFVPEALIESQRITEYLMAGGAVDGLENPAHNTPLVNDAAQLRPDLWDTAVNLKQLPGFSCGAQQVACAEVELVHAGNEFNQQGWRHAKPYVQMAEDLMGAATQAADNCSAEITQTMASEKAKMPISMLVNVLFNFDEYTIDEALHSSMIRLDNIISQINAGQYTLANLSLTGHADRSNHTGDPNYNLLLSQRRAKAVLNYLANNGIEAANTPISYKGDSNQINACEEKSNSRVEYEACLLPNRRVEVHLKLLPKQ